MQQGQRRTRAAEHAGKPGLIQQHLLVGRPPEGPDLLGLLPGGKDALLDPQRYQGLEMFIVRIIETCLPVGHRSPGHPEPLAQALLGQADAGAQREYQLPEAIVPLAI